MSPAAHILTQLGFVKIGPQKGCPNSDLWEYRVERDASATVIVTLPNAEDAAVSWATAALVAAGEERQRHQMRYAWDQLKHLMQTPPLVPLQDNLPD